MKSRPFLFALLALLFVVWGSGTCLQAQAGEEEQQSPPDVEPLKFRVEQAQVAGGDRPWLRLLVDFGSRPDWADGIVFDYTVLVRKGDDYRVLTGTARYSNVKRGRHSAVVYLSPGMVERFGTPIAAKVTTIHKDESSGQLEWSAEGQQPPSGWDKQFRRFPSQLLSILSTPFVATEYGKYPDAVMPR